MTGKTHAAFGVATSLTVATIAPDIFTSGAILNDIDSFSVEVILVAAGALFADLDSAKSLGNKILNKIILAIIFALPIILLFVYSGGSITDIPINLLGSLLALIGIALFCRTRPHREFSHSFFTAIITTFLIYVGFSGRYWLWFGLGYLTHLIIDLPNKKGEDLLWPLINREGKWYIEFDAKKRVKNRYLFCLNLCSSTGLVNSCIFNGSLIVIALMTGYQLW